jgi:hypothetical protein
VSDPFPPAGHDEPATAMAAAPGGAGTMPPPPFAAPPQAEPPQAPRPAWVLPTTVGIVAVAAVLLALIFTRDGNDAAAPAVDTTTSSVAPETTSPPSTAPDTTAPDTTAPETSAPATSVEPTTVPPTTVARTTLPPTGPIADAGADLGVGGASIATADGTNRFDAVVVCASTVTVGLQAESAVLTDDFGHVYVIDVFLDEGSPTGSAQITDMSEAVAGFVYGQDTPGNNSRWTAELPESNLIDRLTFDAVDGTSAPINVSANWLDPSACGQGFLLTQSPFPAGGPITFVDQFDEPIPGEGFAVLAACNDSTYITTGGGLLDQFPVGDGSIFSASYLVDDPTDPMLWATPDGVSSDDQLVEQYGGGGDTDLATNVSSIDGTQWGYLRFTVQPTVPGGLTVINCGS